nr:hypothetical protein [Butyrivibrio sp.]
MAYNKSLDFLNMIKNGESALGNNAFNKTESPIKTERLNKSEPLSKTALGPEIQDVQNIAKAHARQVNCKSATTSIQTDLFAVIDTETNWHDEVMSLGVAIADKTTFRCLETRYYIFEQEARVGGMYSSVLYKCANTTASANRNGATLGTAQTTTAATSPITVARATAMADLSDYLSSHGITSIYAYNAKFDCGHLPELQDYNWYDIMRIAAYKQFNKSIPDTAPCCKTGRLKSNYGVEPITRMLSGNDRYYEVHNAVADAIDELRIIELLGLPLDSYDIALING